MKIKQFRLELLLPARQQTRMVKYISWLTLSITLSLHAACKESRVRQPRASGFCDRVVNSVLNLPDGQAKIFQKIKITKVLKDKRFKLLINSCEPKVAPTK